jgi:dihydrofolate reductase
LVREFDPAEIQRLKEQPGKGIIVFGSGTIVSELTKHRLIDEYQFIVSPVLLGNGKQLLGNLTKLTKLRLLEAKSSRAGNVVLRYALA